MQSIPCRNHFLLKKGSIGRILTIMKVTCIFLLAFCMNANAKGFSQNVRISKKNASLNEVFKEIKNQTGYTFVYKEALLDKAKKVSVSISRGSVEQVLDVCFKDQPLTYTILNKMVIIKEKEEVREKEKVSSSPPPAPPISITGKVTNERGEQLAGASIAEKGTNNITTSREDGTFSLTVSSENSVLLVSYVGYAAREVGMTNSHNLSIALSPALQDRNEVVVVGYGTQKKVSLTSAVSTIKSEDVSRRVVSNTQQALQGIAPGLTVLDQGGAPGRSTATVRVRGITTLSGNNPLILVDGIEQGFNNFNPEDVESISVLKDAAATAIYGSRAAAGVILVTTKRAKEGKLNIGYNTYLAFHTIGDHPQHMTTADYMRQQDTAYAHAGQAMPYSDSLINVWTTSPDRIKYPLANDWYNQLYKVGPQYNNNLSISGGNKQFKGLLNVRYMNQAGIVSNFSNQIKDIRLNTDFAPSSKLKLSVDANYRMLYSTTPNDADNVFFNTLHGAQFVTPRFLDGGYGLSVQGNNPLVNRDLSGYNNDWYNYFSGNLRGEWQILQGLKFSTQYGIVSTSDRNKSYRKSYAVKDENYPSRTKTVAVNQLTEARTNTYQETINSLLEYRTKFGNHNIGILGGYSQIYSRGDAISASRNNLYNNNIEAISAGDVSSRDNSGSDNESGLRSYFGRVNYDFSGKYLLEANGRYDGSSNFTENNLYSFFPSFSAGWRISQEKFWSALSTVIPEFKVRGSWGKTGNQTVGAYSFYEALNLQNYNFSGLPATGYTLRNYANKDLKWETTTQTDLGLDAAFLKNKLNLTFDYYNKRTNDILLSLPIPAVVGLNPPVQNAGVVSNKGWEVLVNYRSRAGKLSYDFSFNISNNINTVVDLKGTGPYISGSNNDALYVIKEGLPINALWGYKTNGLYKDKADVDKSPKLDPNSVPGDVKYLDINNDGKITADDRTMVGDPYPHYAYGFTSNLQYMGFDFNLLLQGAVKQDARVSGAFADAGNNQGFVIDLQNDYWTPSNPNARFPRPQKFTDRNANMSDFWVLHMGYLRIKNVQLGYTLPQSLVSRIKIQRARIYVSGTNIFTISQAKKWGIDPEFPSGRANYYPQTKAYTIGLNINF